MCCWCSCSVPRRCRRIQKSAHRVGSLRGVVSARGSRGEQASEKSSACSASMAASSGRGLGPTTLITRASCRLLEASAVRRRRALGGDSLRGYHPKKDEKEGLQQKAPRQPKEADRTSPEPFFENQRALQLEGKRRFGPERR